MKSIRILESFGFNSQNFTGYIRISLLKYAQKFF